MKALQLYLERAVLNIGRLGYECFAVFHQWRFDLLASVWQEKERKIVLHAIGGCPRERVNLHACTLPTFVNS